MSIAKSITQITRMFDPHKPVTALYELPQTKPPFSPSGKGIALPRATPEATGISSRLLADLLHTIDSDPTLNLHSLLIVRSGKCILDVSFRGYDTSVWKYTYSACKSIVALAIGVLVDQGKIRLSDKLEGYLPSCELNAITRLKIKDLTIEHLLTMSTGSSFNEFSTVAEENWLRGFLTSTFKGGNDTLFAYNSLNTYILAYLICRLSGTTLTAFLKEYFFDPMGIADYSFETCPMGVEKGGWGLYIRPEDFAKFGILVLHNGMWEGKQLVSSEYLDKATSLKRKVPEDYGGFDYGYQMWVGRQRDTVLFNGMHGQNVLIDRANDLVLVSTAGNNEMFQQSTYFTYIEQYLFSHPLPDEIAEDSDAGEYLQSMLRTIQPAPYQPPKARQIGLLSRLLGKKAPTTPLPTHLRELNHIAGLTLYPTSDHANCMGIFPRMFQVTQGRYTSGLASVGFSACGDRMMLYWNENEQKHQLLLGYGMPYLSSLSCGNTEYLTYADYRFARDEYGQCVLMIRIDFIETPYTRFLKFRFLEDGEVELEMKELPGSEFLLRLAHTAAEDLKALPVIGSVLTKMDNDYLEFLVKRVLEPKVRMKDVKPQMTRQGPAISDSRTHPAPSQSDH